MHVCIKIFISNRGSEICMPAHENVISYFFILLILLAFEYRQDHLPERLVVRYKSVRICLYVHVCMCVSVCDLKFKKNINILIFLQAQYNNYCKT